jgi:hypothetical protein
MYTSAPAAASPAARSAAISACASPARAWKPVAMICPSRAMTQPTMGLGLWR